MQLILHYTPSSRKAQEDHKFRAVTLLDKNGKHHGQFIPGNGKHMRSVQTKQDKKTL